MSFLDVISAAGSIAVMILVILLAYFATRWYARRMGAAGAGKYIRILDRVNVGSTSSLVIAKAGEGYYLLGISEKNMQMLAKLEGFDETDGESPVSPSADVPFGQMLRGFLDKSKRDDGGP